MTAKVLQNFQNSRVYDKSFIIEMNEAPGNVKTDFSFNAKILQPKNFPDMSQIPGKPPCQGSITSLESKAFVDQSEEQPLTEVHTCRYDECHKFRQTRTDKETTENPGSPLKNASLILVIVLLLFWIVIYTVLTQLKVL